MLLQQFLSDMRPISSEFLVIQQDFPGTR